MIVLTVSIVGFLLYLSLERLSISRWRRSIPMVITVTGTRGKSTVVRLLASVLREDGRKVMAKTTGTEAKLLWPDGEETAIRRRGVASIIEQKTLLRTAARRNMDCVVAEIMSIHPDNHYVESQQILKPEIVAVTNAWPDHVDALGHTEEEIAQALALDIPDRATVFATAASCLNILGDTKAKGDARLISVPHGSSAIFIESVPKIGKRDFAESLDLVWSIAKHVGVNDDVIRRGLTKNRQDSGALKIWEWSTDKPAKRLLVVNGFAANDPESTMRVLAKVRDLIPPQAQLPVGLLCLRADRGDRTKQWIDALIHGAANQFSRLYVYGGHARVVARKVKTASALTDHNAASLMYKIHSESRDGTVIFGFGNIVGMGRDLVDFCDSTGVVHGL